ncbi:MAG: histidine phosphatase family protein [Pseudomonadota bacterium]
MSIIKSSVFVWQSALCVVALAAAGVVGVASPADANSRAFSALAKGQAVAIVRHAKAPHPKGRKRVRGTKVVNLMSCASQRNLSAAGRRQAARIGAALKRRGVRSARIISSAYCRTMDTARLLNLGSVSWNYDLNALSKPTARRQTAGFRSLLRNAPAGRATIIVTHKTNIRALTGVTPASGETLIVNRKGRVLARLRN